MIPRVSLLTSITTHRHKNAFLVMVTFKIYFFNIFQIHTIVLLTGHHAVALYTLMMERAPRHTVQ